MQKSQPDIYTGDMMRGAELHQWVESNLAGKVVGSLEELKGLFPAEEKYGGVFKSEENVKRGGVCGYDLFLENINW